MIQIRVTEKEDLIKSISIHGHAGYAEKGKDLVCAAVSGIAFGLCNAVDTLIPDAAIVVDNNRITIDIPYPTENTQLVMETGLISLKTVEESNQDYVKIKMEV